MVNNVVLVGRITRDPEVRNVNGVNTVSFTLAIDRNYKSQNGDTPADFVPCVAWRYQADFISNYVKKGNMLSVVGSIQTRQYTDQQGQTRYVTEVRVDNVSNLTPKGTTATGDKPANSYRPQSNVSQQVDNSFNENIEDDDLPF